MLSRNLDTAAGLAAVHSLGYQKGFDDGRLLREFCEPAIDATYFPMGDSRPTAERLAWSESSLQAAPE